MSNDVTKVGTETALTEETFLDEIAGNGMEHIDADAIVVPFLRLATPGMAELTDGKASRIPGLQGGMFFDSVTRQVYGAEIDFIPIDYTRVWIEYGKNQGGSLCHSFWFGRLRRGVGGA